MNTNDPLMFDQRYPTRDFDNDNYLFSQPAQYSNKDFDGTGSQGRRVYLESPSFGNKEEEDMYRYVQSRLTDRTSSIVGQTLPAPTGVTLMDSLDFDLDLLGANHTRAQPAPTMGNLSHVPRADPRNDPLLGPLLAELDAMSNTQQQQQQSLPKSAPRRPSLPYQSNLVQPGGSSNHTLTNLANRTVNDALFEAELNDSLPRKDQQRSALPVTSTQNYNSTNYTRPNNMDGTDIFMPSSYTNAPSSFLSHFGPEDQLFQRPLLNNLGHNYVPNPRPVQPPSQQHQQQRDHSFDQSQTRISPPHRTNYPPPFVPAPPSSNPFIEYERSPPQQHQQHRHEEKHPTHSQDLFFTDHNDEQVEPPSSQQQQQQQHRQNETQDQDSRRQAVWNELQRTNAKAQEKGGKKHESANRNRAPFGSTFNWNNSGSQQSSTISKSPQRPFHHPPPVSKPNHIEENIDMIKNKENSYHRSPTRKYENSYAKRKDLHSGGGYDRIEPEPRNQPLTTNPQRHGSLPITLNLNTGDEFPNGSGTMAVPIDTHVSRVGDKISVNIDLRLVDAQNAQQQQGMDHPPQWASGDPLDRHIRKLERNIEQTLPTPYPPQRSPPISTTGSNPSQGRYSKPSTGANRGGYNPPVYSGSDYSNYNDRNREDDSYLSKLSYARKNPQFKPYTGRDYEQFKKNYGFGTGYLASGFENTTHKERSDQLARTRQYAHQIEARNKKKLSESSRRTLSDTRLTKAPRPREYPPSAVRQKQFSGKSTYSSPAILNEPVPFIPARRPTEVLYRPAPLSRLPPTKLPELDLQQPPVEVEKLPKKSALSNRGRTREEERIQSRRLSPTKPLPTIPTNNKRRPVRFDDIPTSAQQQPTKNDSTNNEHVKTDVIRPELTDSNEQLLTIKT